MPSKPHRKGKLVDFLNHVDDHDCALYGSLGFSTRFICEKTNLSECQVTYRLQKAGLTRENNRSRMDFRNGTSPFSKLVISQARQLVDQDLMKFLKHKLG